MSEGTHALPFMPSSLDSESLPWLGSLITLEGFPPRTKTKVRITMNPTNQQPIPAPPMGLSAAAAFAAAAAAAVAVAWDRQPV